MKLGEAEWNVYYYDINTNEIKTGNILKNLGDLIYNMRCKAESKEAFEEELRKEMMFRYWSKIEWELTVGAYGVGDGSEQQRIDVYDQIRLNWDKFVSYCWNYRRIFWSIEAV